MPYTGANTPLGVAWWRELPVGAVFYLRERWWRKTPEGLMDLIVPRRHFDNMFPNQYGTPGYHDAQARCAMRGCYLCRAMIREGVPTITTTERTTA